MINIGVIGCGQWGLNHIRVFCNVGGARVLRAADVDAGRLARIREQFPNVECVSDWQTVTADPEINAVVVATPASAHYPIAVEALQAGKHVLCEKPLCLTVAEANALHDLSRATGRVLMVGHVFLFNPGIVKLKELIDEGSLGRVYHLSAARTNLGPIRNDVNAAYDLASHDISIFNWLLGAVPEAVSATGSAFLQPDVEDTVFINLRYPGNVIANIQASWLSPKKIRQITVVGSQRMVTWDDLEVSNPVAIFDKGAGAKLEYEEYGEFLKISLWDGDVRMPKVHLQEPLKIQNQAFLHAVQAGAVERSDAEFATGVVRVLEDVAGCMRNKMMSPASAK